MSYENKLLQMKSLLKKTTKNTTIKPIFQKPSPPPYLKEWKEAGLETIENEYGIVFKKKTSYPIDYVHGDIQLNQFKTALDMWRKTEVEHPFLISENEDVLFFDTETTGLKGTGTLIFLIGFLKVEELSIELTQYVLADPGNEVAFLFETKLWERSSTLLSYNGKSFDWPQIETRWTMNREHLPPLKSQHHIDLLMGTRRMWKNELERFKLTKIEEEKLGFHRQDDIPGHLAPVIYLDAVKSGRPELLLKVMRHNEWDILSLLTLYIRSTQLLLSDFEIETATTITNIGKWYADLKSTKRSKHLFEYVTHTFKNDAANAFFFLGFQLKREKLFDEALYAFHKSVDGVEGKRKIDACIELAKLYEHRVKDIEKAKLVTIQAMELVNNSEFLNSNQLDRLVKQLDRRYSRLEMKKLFPG